MGVKYEGGDLFNTAINGLTAVPGVTSEMVYETARPLIEGLLRLGWDNAGSTVGEHEGNPAVVAAFKDNGVPLFCDTGHPDNGESCEVPDRGHERPHRDFLGRTWTSA
jgi:hypothetical protein